MIPSTETSPSATVPQSGSVLILTECKWGRLEKVTFELLGEARRIATALKCRTEVILLTSPSQSSKLISELRVCVEEHLHVVEHTLLEDYSTEVYLECLDSLLSDLNPRMLLLAGSSMGRDFGPRLAARRGIGYLPNCLTIKPMVGGQLEITRVTHGGHVHVQSVWPGERPAILTMKPGVGDAAAPLRSPANPEITRHLLDVKPGRVRMVERLPANPAMQDIREAEHIVSGGRGVGGLEGFAMLRELADSLHAAVGASRVAVDLGWIEYARQVGQTGKTVAPRLYIAAGISGASHHLMGMRGSEKIVAINTDKQAAIFSVAHLGIAGDLQQVLPRLTQRVRQRRSEH